jgi:hypothetical protein
VIPVIISRGDPDKLFAAVSGTSKPLTSVDWLEMFLNGTSIDHIPAGVNKNNIKKLYEILGGERLRRLAKDGLKPGVYQTARRVNKYCSLSMDDASLARTIEWCITRKTAIAVAADLQSQRDPKEIVRAIQEDISL